MAVVCAFALLLLVAVFGSSLAHRSILSAAVLFLVGGFVLGQGVAGVVRVDAGGPVVGVFAELALFSVLFTDGMRIGVGELRSAWRLPGRALILGLPLTLLLIAVLAHLVTGLGWVQAFLVGAALSPTDPVFASAIVGREEIPARLRQLLNVESGLNDGLALPVVVILLSAVAQRHTHAGVLLAQVAAGVALGLVIPGVVVLIARLTSIEPTERYAPLNGFGIGLLVLSLTSLVHANEFLAAFVAGIVLASIGKEIRTAFERFGEIITELLKLAALFVFGALLSPALLVSSGIAGLVLALATLVVARPVSIELSLLRSRLDRKERFAAAWFGPKGFASVVYGLLIAQSGFEGSDKLFHLIALVVAISIVAHSSTDVVVAKWFKPAPQRDAAQSGPEDLPQTDRASAAGVDVAPRTE